MDWTGPQLSEHRQRRREGDPVPRNVMPPVLHLDGRQHLVEQPPMDLLINQARSRNIHMQNTILGVSQGPDMDSHRLEHIARLLHQRHRTMTITVMRLDQKRVPMLELRRVGNILLPQTTAQTELRHRRRDRSLLEVQTRIRAAPVQDMLAQAQPHSQRDST
jgi:hypothetical protein